MKHINIRIASDASSVNIEAEGYEGTGCMNDVKKVLVGLGAVQEDGKKPAYFGSVAEGVYTGN